MSEKIAFVGVGRMGANMARRLKDQGFEVVAVYDAHPEHARELAAELGCAAPATLPEVSDAADIVITVVTDDEAMDDIFGSVGCGSDSLLGSASGVQAAEGRLFVNCATVSPGTHLVESRRQRGRRAIARSLHGLEHHAGTGGHALSHVRRQTETPSSASKPVLGSFRAPRCATSAPTGEAAQGEGARQHGHEHQHRRPRRRSRPRRTRSGSISTMLREVFSPDRRRIRACSRPTARTCRTATTLAFSRAAHAAKDSGIALRSRAKPA